MTSLNEQIARLLEPEPNARPDSLAWTGFILSRSDAKHYEPKPFRRSIDASMAVIEKRWPGACVELSVASAASPFALARIRASTTGPILGDATQVTQHSKENGGQVEPHPTADALALALLSALRAQPEQAK